MNLILINSPYVQSTKYFCIDELSENFVRQPEADAMMVKITTEINSAISRLPKDTLEVQIQWRNIIDFELNPDGKIGFFRVYGRPQ